MKETITLSALLRLPREIPDSVKHERVDLIIQVTHLCLSQALTHSHSLSHSLSLCLIRLCFILLKGFRSFYFSLLLTDSEQKIFTHLKSIVTRSWD